MNIQFSQKFIVNIKKLRISLGITEAMMDSMLQEYDLVYTGVESQSEKSISLDFAKRVSNLFLKDIDYFLNKDCILITKEQISPTLSAFLTKQANDTANKKISLAACVVVYLSYYNTKKTFVNSEILHHLPAPLNKQTSIDWTSGLLKGLVINTKKYKKNPLITDKRYHGEVYYELKGPIPKEILAKALKKVDLALFEQKKRS